MTSVVSSVEFFGSAGGRSNKSVFLSYEVGDDDLFSPVTGGRVPLLCPVDLDSLYMLLRNDFMNAETGGGVGLEECPLWNRTFVSVTGASRFRLPGSFSWSWKDICS